MNYTPKDSKDVIYNRRIFDIMYIMFSSKKGFTLIELLVVVAIIGLLASVIMVSLNSARAKGRDARRMSDIKQISNAIELYISTYDHVPDLGNSDCLIPNSPSWSCVATSEAGVNWSVLESELSPFMAKLPTDPSPATNNSWYTYYAPSNISTATDSYTYGIFAQNLETKSGNFGFGVMGQSY